MKKLEDKRIKPEEAYCKLREDPYLKPIVERWNRCIIKHGENYLWELIRSILAQQISTRVAQKLGERLKEYYQGNVTSDRVACSSAEELRELGISTRKAETILSIASLCVQGDLKLEEFDKKKNSG